jgi:hypothetical protein
MLVGTASPNSWERFEGRTATLSRRNCPNQTNCGHSGNPVSETRLVGNAGDPARQTESHSARQRIPNSRQTGSPETAILVTRPPKSHIPETRLFESWDERLHPALGYSPIAIANQNRSIPAAQIGANQRSGLGFQTPLRPKATPERESKPPHRYIRSNRGS